MRQKKLYDYFYYKAFIKNAPVGVMIELLTQCNLRCEHCYLPTHTNKGLDFEAIKQILYDLREMGVVNISLTGGEIFLREDIFDIIELARSLYMRVFLLSNGTLLDGEKVRRLAQLHIAEFSTTIFSMRNEVHDSITGKKGSLQMVVKNLDLLKEYGIAVRVKTPIMQKNLSEIQSVKDYCVENGFEYLVSPLIFSKNNGDDSPKKLRIKNEDLITAMEMIDSINRNDHLHVNDVPCSALFYSFSIDCNGDVYPCNSFLCKVGNIFENSLHDIWYHSEKLNFIKNIKNSDLKECLNCEYKSECDRCPGMVFMESKNFYSCDCFSKTIAKIRLSNYTEV